MTIAFIAAACMLVQDALNSVKVQAQSRRMGWLAGMIDVAAWLCFLATTKFSLDALHSNSTSQKVMVIGLVSCANLFGQRIGESIGRKLVKDETSEIDKSQNSRIATLEKKLGIRRQK